MRILDEFLKLTCLEVLAIIDATGLVAFFSSFESP
jgi:hypothetical protein